LARYPAIPNEQERLATLLRTGILDTPADPLFEAVCHDAAEKLAMPIAIVSLVDRDRQWFKAVRGLSVSETVRDIAFCAHAIQSDEVFVVPDARADCRFADNPLVTGDPNIVFYAGAPIIFGEGVRLGTVCVIDSRPRVVTAADLNILTDLADRAAGEIWAFACARGERWKAIA